MLSPGTKAPDFSSTACVSIEKGKEFKTITNKDFNGKWIVFYTYPKDFADRGAVVLGGSTDNEFSHLAWRNSHADLKKINHPLLHVSPDFANAYGLLQPQAGVALRATYIIDPQGIVRYASANDLSVGRNVAEVLRVLDGLQTDELCPCNWNKGEETLTAKLKKVG
jgi:peroxiredoxin (alkyl hydroperoxide reductase subunit C)